ncbi:MAG: 2-C-methyl-D-erythritol 4-phosphate cytidylyltransferase [Chloroflexi bacterium]|nr:2-C-methyl-D-erythritol 4-phosphate cytidylyltransferase [Chloroflexota bacterium]
MSPVPSPRTGGPAGNRVGAIVVAGGRSRRMDGPDKLFLPLLGRPLLGYTLDVLQRVDLVREVVLVLSQSNLERGRALVAEREFHKVTGVCLGGPRRQDSVRLGLQALSPCDWVVVHDGARPCVEPELVERGLEEARKWGSAVAAVPVHDTLKSADSEGRVTATVDREGIWAVQTPQVFPSETLREAHRQVDATATDDAALVEWLGRPVHLYTGSQANIKVTTSEDLLMAEAVLRHRGEAPV